MPFVTVPIYSDVMPEIEKDLAQGRSVVISLFNAGEAQADRKVRDARAQGLELREMDATPREMIVQLIENQFPIYQYQERTDPVTGKVNSGAFKGFAVGECLFLGAAGAKRGSGDWEITFRFAASPNVTNLTIGDITGVDKKGWEYLWVRYADSVDDTAKALVKKPIAAYVELRVGSAPR